MAAWLAPLMIFAPGNLVPKGIAGLSARFGALRLTRQQILAICLVLSLAIALVDRIAGPNISASITYAIPVLIAAWFLGMRSAFWLSIPNVIAWLFLSYRPLHPNDLFGAVESSLIRFFIFIAFAAILVRLNHLQKNLELLAEARAHALMKEAAERARLERELLDIGEREQQRIGRDLHDGLCQHLAGTALVSQLLAGSLANSDDIKKTRAHKIVDLLEEAISLARGIAKGLHPIEMQADGLMRALDDFASTTSVLFGIKCRFVCFVPVLIHTSSTAAHLYRITQEAVNNAIRHGHATEIEIVLEESDDAISLGITDNGTGFTDQHWNQSGIGLRSMAARVKMINGEFSIASTATGGVAITCLIPGSEVAGLANIPPQIRKRNYAKS